MSKYKLVLLMVLSAVSVAHPARTVRLSCSDIKEFVDGHNRARRLVARGKLAGQPKASNMQLMRWDKELATKAENYAKLLSRKKFKHNSDSTVPSGRFTTGENLAWLGSMDVNYKPNLTHVVQGWFQEYKDYSYSDNIDMRTFAKTGHYTQMVWAETNLIGCGVSKDVRRMITYNYVCNYGPAGNYNGRFPYKKGAGCENLCGDNKGMYGECIKSKKNKI